MNQYELEDNAELSEYEKIRLVNIKRNNDRLISLGLISESIYSHDKIDHTVIRRKKRLFTLPTRTKLGRIAKEKARTMRMFSETIRKMKPDMTVNKRTAAKPVEKMDRITGLFLQYYESGSSAAEDVNGHQSAISNVCNQRIKTHKGYCWRFAAGITGIKNKVIKTGKTRVRKQFINKEVNKTEWFNGLVSCKCGRYYHITYNDGDSEDMTWKEVLACMK